MIPEHPSQFEAIDIDLDHVRRSYLRKAIASVPEDKTLTDADLEFLAAETRTETGYVIKSVEELRGKAG